MSVLPFFHTVAFNNTKPCLRRGRFRLGDNVVALVGYGGYTTDLVTKEVHVAPLPPGMDLITGSSFFLAYGTADYALRVSWGSFSSSLWYTSPLAACDCGSCLDPGRGRERVESVNAVLCGFFKPVGDRV